MPDIIESMITIPERLGVPACHLYTKQYRKTTLGERNTIVLLPGGPGNDCSIYDTPSHSIAKLFFGVADVVLFDPRNCGASDAGDVKYCSLDHYIDDVEALRIVLDLSPEKFFIFGQSYGAIAAIGYAARYPCSLKKLLLIGGVVSSDFYKQAQQALARIASPEQVTFAEKLWQGKFQGTASELLDYYRLMSPLYSYRFDPSEPPLDIRCNIDVLNFGWGDFLQRFDFSRDLPSISCDTLILWGEQEWMMPRSHIDQLHRDIPCCHLRVYPECMHMLWIDQWQRFTVDAIAFLKD